MRISYKNKSEIEQFWVGLIDSDGSVQCNHWKERSLQFRIVIKMHLENMPMLLEIKKHLGGSVRLVGENQCVWVEDHRRKIWELCKIFYRFPPLTTRVRCQLLFLELCAKKKSVPWMLENRDLKYKNREQFVRSPRDLRSLPYFPIWCSGFITGEGCFSARTLLKASLLIHVKSFSIAQKHDSFLLEAIRDFFGGTNRVRSLPNHLYLWEVYRREVIASIIAHCDRFPLLGKKKDQLETFKRSL